MSLFKRSTKNLNSKNMSSLKDFNVSEAFTVHCRLERHYVKSSHDGRTLPGHEYPFSFDLTLTVSPEQISFSLAKMPYDLSDPFGGEDIVRAFQAMAPNNQVDITASLIVSYKSVVKIELKLNTLRRDFLIFRETKLESFTSPFTEYLDGQVSGAILMKYYNIKRQREDWIYLRAYDENRKFDTNMTVALFNRIVTYKEKNKPLYSMNGTVVTDTLLIYPPRYEWPLYAFQPVKVELVGKQYRINLIDSVSGKQVHFLESKDQEQMTLIAEAINRALHRLRQVEA